MLKLSNIIESDKNKEIIDIIEKDLYNEYILIEKDINNFKLDYEILCNLYIDNEKSKILNDSKLFNLNKILEMLNYNNVNEKFIKCIIYDNINCIIYYINTIKRVDLINIISIDILKELLLYHPNSKVFNYLISIEEFKCKFLFSDIKQEIYNNFNEGDVQRSILFNNIEQIKYLVENKNIYIHKLLKEWNFYYKISIANTDVYKYLYKECKEYIIY